MARREIVVITDDVDGSQDTSVGLVRFSYEGTDYEIDLSAVNRDKLSGILSPYIAAGRRLARFGRPVPTRTVLAPVGRGYNDAARAWLLRNGYESEVKTRGRISSRLLAAYETKTPASA
jgi:hypothetical protein